MSGHSKWSTIKRQKGLNDAKRGQSFTKVANAISIAARLGGSGEPESNPRLRMVLEEARSINMPKDNIQRAIDRGLGRLPGQTLEEALYEGFGPGKVAYIIEAVTDNKLRTTSEIRNLFDRAGGALGTNGVTAYMFDHLGEIHVQSKAGQIEDETLELIDLGASDVVELSDDGKLSFLVYCQPTELMQLSTKITQSGYTVTSAELIYQPNLHTNITDAEQASKIIAFTERIEDHDDVQKVYANFDIPDEMMQDR